MIKSVIACAALMSALLLAGCGGIDSAGGGDGDDDPKPAFVRVSAIGTQDVPTGTFWARSSSGDGLASNPIRVVVDSETMTLNDAFHIGKKGSWELWLSSGTYPAGSAIYKHANDELILDASTSVHYRTFNGDGSIKKTYDGTVHLVLHKDEDVIPLLEFTPATPDEDLPGKETLAFNQDFPETDIQFDLGGPF